MICTVNTDLTNERPLKIKQANLDLKLLSSLGLVSGIHHCPHLSYRRISGVRFSVAKMSFPLPFIWAGPLRLHLRDLPNPPTPGAHTPGCCPESTWHVLVTFCTLGNQTFGRLMQPMGMRTGLGRGPTVSGPQHGGLSPPSRLTVSSLGASLRGWSQRPRLAKGIMPVVPSIGHG